MLVYSGKNKAKQEDLKEMGDISSGMSSSIMQIYLKQVLDSFLHSQSTVRHFALNVISLTLNQGLIHPVQVCLRSYASKRTHWRLNIIYVIQERSELEFYLCHFVFSVSLTWLPWEQIQSQPWRTRPTNNWWRSTKNIQASSTWVATELLFPERMYECEFWLYDLTVVVGSDV